MTRQKAIFYLAGIYLFWFSINVGAMQGQPAAGDRNGVTIPMMKLDDVRPGMVGTVRTVFRGDEIEEFGFEVLGVMPSALGPKQDIILVRLKGEKPEFTGVVAGMSGSPVFIDGKLVGALSLRFGLFAKEPIAGITPIESMLPVFDIKESQLSQRRVSRLGKLRDTHDRWQNPNGAPSSESDVVARHHDLPRMLEPIPTPLFFSGIRQEVIDRFGPLFEQYHLTPLRAGSAASRSQRYAPDEADDFVPGAPIAAVLMSGDIGIYATGTISYRDQDRVLAFGHPFFQLGETEMPMAKATILTTLASDMASFKIAQVGDVVGAVRQDRLTAIMGRIGRKPDMIPVDVRMKSPSRGVIPYHYEIFQHPDLTPLLLNISLFSSIVDSLEQAGEMTLRVEGKMRLEGHPDLTFRNLFSSTDGGFFTPLAFLASGQISSLFDRLFTNPVEAARVSGVEVSFEITEERQTTMIEEVRIAKQEVRPGEELSLYVALRPYRGPTEIRHLTLKVPEKVRSGDQLKLLVSGAAPINAIEQLGRSGRGGSLDALIAVLNRERPNDRLYVRLSQASPGYIINQQQLPSLPPSLISVIESSQVESEAIKMAESTLLIESIDVGSVVQGRRDLVLQVK